MTRPQPPKGSPDAIPQREETDDYDLLTYGEVGARLAELLEAERAALAELRGNPRPDPVRARQLEERVELLASSQARYQDQQSRNEAFHRRFGAGIPHGGEAW